MDDVKELQSWLEQNDSWISPKAQVFDFGVRGRGLIATDSIKQNEKILVIRRSQLLNSETLAKEKWLMENNLTSHQLLSLYIYMHYYGDNTSDEYWSKYFKTLPDMDSFKNVPMTWTDQPLQWLPNFVQSKVHSMKSKIKHDMTKCQTCIDIKIDPIKYLWAWLCVNSRCIYMDLHKTSSDNMTLVPIMDMVNHSATDNDMTVISITALGLTFIAGKDFDKGDEITFSYGSHDNSTLLCEYGFTVAGNNWTTVDIAKMLQNYIEDRDDDEQVKTTLDSLGYWGEYTINRSGLSFRTEVAIAGLVLGRYNSAQVRSIVNGSVDICSIKGVRAVAQEIVETSRGEILDLAPENDHCQRIKRDYLDLFNHIEHLLSEYT